MNEKNDPHHEKANSDPAEDDFIIELTNEIEMKSEDDEDALPLDNLDANLTSDDTDTKMNEAVFDLGEEMGFKQSNDEDKYDFFDIDDDETDDEKDRVSLLENLDLEFGEEDDIISLDAELEEKSGSPALDEEETPENNQTGDLPDLLAELEFEFEEDEEGIIALDEQPEEANNNLIARAVEQSAASDEDADRIAFAEKGEEPEDETEATILGDPRFDDDDLLLPDQTEIGNLELEEDLLKFDDDFLLKPEDDILPAEVSDSVTAQKADDIIEITEFDQHFPEEDEKILERAGVLDAADEEDDEFLELIEIEEDDSLEDEAGMASNESEMNDADAQISNFLSNTFEEDDEFEDAMVEIAEEPSTLSSEMTMEDEAVSSEDEEFDLNLDTQEISQHIDGLDVFLSDESGAEPEVTSFSEDHPEEEKSEPEAASLSEDQSEEKGPEPEMVSVPEIHLEEEGPELVTESFAEDHAEEEESEPEMASLSENQPEEEEPEAVVDSFSENQPEEAESEPLVASFSEDHPAEKEILQEEVPADPEPGESAAVTPELVSAALERVINEKFSGQIESIIYEVIEKAVTKEIDRLKVGLLQGGNLDDNL